MIFQKAIFFLQKRKLFSQLKSVGSNFIFCKNSDFITSDIIEIGDNIFIGQGAYISAAVKIGNNVMFGPFPTILGGNHYFGVRGKSNRFLKAPNRENVKQIIIEDEVWCGASVIILGGTTLHKGAVVGTGSIVNRSLPPFAVCSGNPCKPLKLIFSDTDFEIHLQELGYNDGIISETIEKRKELIACFKLRSDELKIVNNTAEYLDLYKNAK